MTTYHLLLTSTPPPNAVAVPLEGDDPLWGNWYVTPTPSHDSVATINAATIHEAVAKFLAATAPTANTNTR